jgi:hypothetical protein
VRPGVVSTIRVNPKDCMSIIDVIALTGIDTTGMSFAAMTSLALSSLLETARQNGQVPTRDGFEFNEMMLPWASGIRSKRKLEITEAIGNLGSKIHAPPIVSRLALSAMMKPAEAVSSQVSPSELRQAQVRLTELLQKQDLADGGKVVWMEQDQKEYDQLYEIVYPEG